MSGFTRTAEHRGKTYLMPACEGCGRDDHHVIIRESGPSWILDCRYCDRLWTPSRQDIHRMCEPERLKERMAAVRAGVGW